MDDNRNANKNRLAQLIKKRVENTDAVRQFEDLFFRFSRSRLKEVVHDINNELRKGGSDDVLKVLYDDPYENRRTPYFVLVQLYAGSSKFEFFLDNTKANPSLLFEGLEFNAKVKVAFKLQNENNFKVINEVPIQSLTVLEIENIIIDFLERAYNK